MQHQEENESIGSSQSVDRGSEVEAERRARLRELGVFLPATMEEAHRSRASQPYLVEGLLRTGSINLLVGDSGLGKTPLAIQLGVCVAAGIPLFGLAVQKGPVLYCDAESDLSNFWQVLKAISTYLGLSEPPSDFHIWSPNWYSGMEGSWKEALTDCVPLVGPTLVIADPLRMFWPNAESKNAETAEAITSLRDLSRSTGTSWLISHHRRKVNQQAVPGSLEENPHAWFQEVAGAHALVNQSDTRLGVVPGTGEVDLIVAGFVRGSGPISPLYLARATDEEGTPVGYQLLAGAQRLRPEDRTIFDKLGTTFRFKDVDLALGGSSASNTKRVITRFETLGIARKEGKEYVKVEVSL